MVSYQVIFFLVLYLEAYHQLFSINLAGVQGQCFTSSADLPSIVGGQDGDTFVTTISHITVDAEIYIGGYSNDVSVVQSAGDAFVSKMVPGDPTAGWFRSYIDSTMPSDQLTIVTLETFSPSSVYGLFQQQSDLSKILIISLSATDGTVLSTNSKTFAEDVIVNQHSLTLALVSNAQIAVAYSVSSTSGQSGLFVQGSTTYTDVFKVSSGVPNYFNFVKSTGSQTSIEAYVLGGYTYDDTQASYCHSVIILDSTFTQLMYYCLIEASATVQLRDLMFFEEYFHAIGVADGPHNQILFSSIKTSTGLDSTTKEGSVYYNFGYNQDLVILSSYMFDNRDAFMFFYDKANYQAVIIYGDLGHSPGKFSDATLRESLPNIKGQDSQFVLTDASFRGTSRDVNYVGYTNYFTDHTSVPYSFTKTNSFILKSLDTQSGTCITLQDLSADTAYATGAQTFVENLIIETAAYFTTSSGSTNEEFNTVGVRSCSGCLATEGICSPVSSSVTLTQSAPMSDQTYTIGDAALAVPTNFELVDACSDEAWTFYSEMECISTCGPFDPNYRLYDIFSVDAQKEMQVFTSDSQYVGIWDVTVQGILPNGQSISDTFQLTMNYVDCTSITYTLPTISDYSYTTNNGLESFVINAPSFSPVQCSVTYSTSVLQGSVCDSLQLSSLPSFVSYVDTSQTVSMLDESESPPNSTYDITYLVDFTAPDGSVTTQCEMFAITSTTNAEPVVTIVVTNSTYSVSPNLAPYFSEATEQLQLAYIDETTVLYLGEVVDPDGDSQAVQVAESSSCSFMFSYDSSNYTFTIDDPDEAFIDFVCSIEVDLVDQDGGEASYTLQFQVKDPDVQSIYAIVIQDEEVIEVQEESTDYYIEVEEDDSDYLSVKIESVNQLGELNIQFSEVMIDQEIGIDIQDWENHTHNILDVRVIPGDSSDASLLNFSWYVFKFQRYDLQLILQFQNASSVSSHALYDKIQVEFLNTTYFKSLETDKTIANNTVLIEYLPQQMEQGLIADTLRAAGTSSQIAFGTGVVSQIAINIVFAGSMQMLWGLFNCLQIVSHLPLFTIMTFQDGSKICKMPASAQYFYKAIIKIVNFEVVPEDWVNMLFLWSQNEENIIFDYQTRILQEEEAEELNASQLVFIEAGYSSNYFSNNLGTLFLFFLSLMSVIILDLLLWPIAKYSAKAQQLKEKIHKWLYWNTLIRFLQEGYLQIFICCLINLKFMQTSSPVNFEDYLNSSMSMFFCAMCIIFPFIVARLLNKILADNKLVQKLESVCGCLYQDFRPKKQAFHFNTVFLVRRFFFCVNTILLSEKLFFQCQILCFLSLFSSCYTISAMPFKEKGLNQIEVFNDVFFIALVYHLFLFTDFVIDDSIQPTIGLSCCAITVFMIIVNFYYLVMLNYKEKLNSIMQKKLEISRSARKEKEFKLMQERMKDPQYILQQEIKQGEILSQNLAKNPKVYYKYQPDKFDKYKARQIQKSKQLDSKNKIIMPFEDHQSQVQHKEEDLRLSSISVADPEYKEDLQILQEQDKQSTYKYQQEKIQQVSKQVHGKIISSDQNQNTFSSIPFKNQQDIELNSQFQPTPNKYTPLTRVQQEEFNLMLRLVTQNQQMLISQFDNEDLHSIPQSRNSSKLPHHDQHPSHYKNRINSFSIYPQHDL